MHFNSAELASAISMLLVGVLVGALAAYLWARSRIALVAQQVQSGMLTELTVAREQLASGTREMLQLKGRVPEFERRIAELDGELQTAREQRTQATVHSERVPDLERQIAESARESRRLNELLLSTTDSSAQKSAQIEDLNVRVAAASEKLRLAENSNTQVAAEVRQLGESLAEARTALDAERATSSDLRLRLSETLARAQSELAAVRADSEAFAAARDRLSADLSTVRQEQATQAEQLVRIPELQQELGDARSQLVAAQSAVSGLRQTVGELSTQVDVSRLQLDENRTMLAQTTGERDRAVAEVRQLAPEAAELRTSLEAERSNASQRLTQLNETRQELAEQSEFLSQSRQELATQSEQLARIPELQRDLGEARSQLAAAQAASSELKQRQGELSSQVDALREQAEANKELIGRTAVERDRAVAECRTLSTENAELRTSLDAERNQAVERLLTLNEAREQLSVQFQNLANQILEEKSQRFAQQNQTSLEALLTPLQEKIKSFQEQVAQTYDKDSKERLTLKNEIERLALLNTRISEDAVNLTQALKGSNKTQGIWGEMVLENVLESSGLRKGQEYTVQEGFSAEAGNQQRPDVVIYLPEGKHMVVDSKMSLVAYERYCNADTDAARQTAQRDHLQSLRNHIKGLSEKNYQSLHELKSLDFVLMFVPVEPAFMLAVTNDQTLFNDAFARNVLIVSPSTLLATLRTIANIWRQEHQNRNAQAIADQCARLYDKFVGFVEDLEVVGDRLEKAQRAYQSAHGKLSSGQGNLVRQLDKVRALGVKPSKSLRVGLLEKRDDDEEVSVMAGQL